MASSVGESSVDDGVALSSGIGKFPSYHQATPSYDAVRRDCGAVARLCDSRIAVVNNYKT